MLACDVGSGRDKAPERNPCGQQLPVGYGPREAGRDESIKARAWRCACGGDRLGQRFCHRCIDMGVRGGDQRIHPIKIGANQPGRHARLLRNGAHTGACRTCVRQNPRAGFDQAEPARIGIGAAKGRGARR